LKTKLTKRLLLISLSLVIGLFATTIKLLPFLPSSSEVALAQTNALVGTWKLSAYETRDPQGKLIGSAPWHYDQGLLIYEQDGHMSVQLVNNNRPTFANGDFLTAVKQLNPDGLATAILGYLAYFGTYTVMNSNGQKGIIIHHVETSTNNYKNTDQKRNFELVSDQLILTKLTDPSQTKQGELTSRIVWKQT